MTDCSIDSTQQINTVLGHGGKILKKTLNLLKCSDVRQLHLKVFSAIKV